MITFFVVEASCQTSTALGFAVLEIPDDVRLSGGGAELSADVTSSDGEPLEGVVCVVDLKVIQHLLPVANCECTRGCTISIAHVREPSIEQDGDTAVPPGT